MSEEAQPLMGQLKAASQTVYTRAFDPDQAEMPFSEVIAVAVNNRPAPYHWRIYLKFADGSGAVYLDEMPTLGCGEPGTMLVGSTEEATDRGAAEHFPVLCTGNSSDLDKGLPTVGSIIQTVLFHGRHRYIFDAEGRGCCQWCATVLGDLEKDELLEPDTTKRLYEHDAKLAVERSEDVPTPWFEGKWY